MSTLLTAAVLLAVAGCAALMMNQKLEEQLPLTVALVTGVLYAFGLAGQLKMGVYAVLTLAAAAFAAVLIMLVRRFPRRPWKLLLTPGSVCFALGVVWLYAALRGHMFTAWDDFSHWGLAVKNMALFQALPSGVPQATITYTDYPPATTLFSYFWTMMSGAFNEGDVQRALNMLMLCFLLPAMRSQSWKRPGSACCMACALFVMPMVFDNAAYRGLYVDSLLGVILLHGLHTWLTGRHEWKTVVSVGAGLFMLTLVKGTGIGFAVLLLAVIAADMAVQRRNVPLRTSLRMLGALALPVLFAWISWKLHLRFCGVEKVWNLDGITPAGLLDVLFLRGSNSQTNVLVRFFQALTTNGRLWPGNVLAPSFVLWMLGFLIAGQAISSRSETQMETRRLRTAFAVFAVGTLLYVSSLLLIYEFIFRTDEALRLGSMERYLSSCMIPMLGLPVVLLAEKYSASTKACRVSVPLCVLAFLFLVTDPTLILQETVFGWQKVDAAYHARMNELLPQKAREELNAETDRVYLVVMEDAGLEYYRDAYQLTPVPVQEGFWTTWLVNQKAGTWADLPAVECTAEEWAQVLEEGGFTHVYLDTITEQFRREFGMLFDSPETLAEGRLYRVQNEDGAIILRAAY